jgi:hypothetical protein
LAFDFGVEGLHYTGKGEHTVSENGLRETEGEDIEHFVDEAGGTEITGSFFEIESDVFGVLGLNVQVVWSRNPPPYEHLSCVCRRWIFL